MFSLGIRMFQRPYRSVARRVFLLSGSILIEGNEESRYKAGCAPVVIPGYCFWLCATSAVSRYKAEPVPVVIPGYCRFYGQRRESGFIRVPVVIQRVESPQKP